MANKWILLSDEDRSTILAALPPTNATYKKIVRMSKTIKVSSARGKGMSFQKWICTELSKLLDLPYNQSDDESPIASRPSGGHATDIILRGKARKLFPFSIEAKAVENLNLFAAVEQARTNTEPGMNWMVIHKKKALSEPIVVVGWSTFTGIYKKVLDSMKKSK